MSKDGFTQDQKDTLRKRPQRARWYIAVHEPDTVAELELDETISTFPVSAIKVKSASDTSNALSILGNATKDRTIWLGTNRGSSDLGKARIRRNVNTATSVMPISESGSGLINWANVTHVTVKDEYRPWIKHPRMNTATSQWEMDYNEDYTNQLDIPGYGTYVNIGPPIIGILDENGKFAASFYGDRSLAWDSAINTQQWDFPDGQQVTSLLGTCDNPVVITFDNASRSGSYYSLTLTDAFGASHIGRRLIFLMASRSDFNQVALANISGGIQLGGYKTTATVYNSGHQDKYPDGAEIVIFEEASYNSSFSSIGGNFPHRENIVFRGWLESEITRVGPFTSDTTFTAQTINGIMDKMASYDDFHSATCTGASEWIEAASLCIDRVAFNLLKNRSTISHLTDFYPASGLGITEEIAFQDLPRSSLWQQFHTNYSSRGILAYAGADLQSGLYGFTDAQIDGGSANLPITTEIVKSDRRDIVQISKPHQENVAQVQLYAVKLNRSAQGVDGIGGSHVPLGGESPGAVIGYFGGRKVHSRGLLVDGQDTLITWAGNLRAKLNNEYPKITVPLAGNYRIDPIPQSRVTMSLSATDNVRGIEWNDEQFFPTALKVDYNAQAGAVMTEIDMEKVVNGIGGSAITFPAIADPVTPNPPPDPPPDLPPINAGVGLGTVYVMTCDTLGRTTDFGAQFPQWTNVATTPTGTFTDFILDPWAPKTNGYLVTTDGVYKSTNLNLATPTWSQILADSTIETAVGLSNFRNPMKISASINIKNWVGFGFLIGTSANPVLYFGYSTDGGTTWSYSVIAQTSGFPAKELNDGWGGGLDVLQHLVDGKIVAYAIVAQGQSDTTRAIRIYRTLDSGVTWTLIYTGNNSKSFGTYVHVPYPSNENGNTVFISGHALGTSNTWGVHASENRGVSWRGIGPSTMTKDYEGSRWRGEMFTGADNQAYIWDTADDATLYVSSDGWDGTYNAKNMVGLTGELYSSGGFPYNNNQFYAVTSDGIFSTLDGGDNWQNKTGNWAWGFTSTITIYAPQTGNLNVHPYVIVPLWTE